VAILPPHIYAIKPLEIQQNHAIRICQKKKDLYGSTLLNYKELRDEEFYWSAIYTDSSPLYFQKVK